MKRLLVISLVAALLATVPGCSKNDPDSLTKQSISDMNDLASAIEKKESTDKIKSLAEKMKTTQDKLSALKLSPDDQKKLAEKYQKEIMDAAMKLMAAAMKNPEAMTALSSVGGLGDKFQASSSNTPAPSPTPADPSNGSAGRPAGKPGKK
jgi:peptidoglycan hydrolase CwlO-like protein